ncbi:predicted protein [Thalassiosira pseudonana CCMP1335]|uniref:Uncharacterized protein n=1 Tax=Thalassiosira pseudonana TaxID=35128 RepID=B8CD32_THAPS|nr:predicted protein [Thalassiosira pseudonana CCMP1335]EED88537.1 predicted protein [Thalassiosira pseudonana CCMP1335]
MSLKPVAITLGTASIAAALEFTYTPSIALLQSHSTQLTAVTPFILLGSGFWALSHGFTVGQARTKYAELARKDGEKDVDERYLLPNLYAQGTSKNVKAFNCVQRSHQHIFETFTTVVVGGLAGAVTFPVCTAVSTFLYAIGRVQLSKGYAESEGDATKRYKYPLAKFMWFGFLGNVALGMASCGMIMMGKKTL